MKEVEPIVYIYITILIVMNLSTLVVYYTSYTKEDWRGISKDMQFITMDGDAVVVIPGYIDKPFDYYYSNKTDKTIEYRVSNAKDLSSIRKLQTTHTFYIMTNDIYSADQSGDTIRWLENNTDEIHTGTNVRLFKS
jgi:mannosyltransferase